jgi:hypothetical protein
MKRFLATFVMACAGGFAFSAQSLAAPPSPFSSGALDTGLKSHQVLYDITLESADRMSGVASAKGTMFSRLDRTCDGWISENQTYLEIRYNEGREVKNTWSFASWESLDGLHYRFNVRSHRNGAEPKVVRGEAELESKGGAGTARFFVPVEKTVALPKGTLFPTEHLGWMLRSAQSGNNLFSRVVFDGGDEDNPYEVNVAIGSRKASDRKGKLDTKVFGDKNAWYLHLAFFPFYGKASLPDFEMDGVFREDGIAEAMKHDFGDFSLGLALKEIKSLPFPEC